VVPVNTVPGCTVAAMVGRRRPVHPHDPDERTSSTRHVRSCFVDRPLSQLRNADWRVENASDWTPMNRSRLCRSGILIRHTGGRPLLGYAVQESNWRRRSDDPAGAESTSPTASHPEPASRSRPPEDSVPAAHVPPPFGQPRTSTGASPPSGSVEVPLVLVARSPTASQRSALPESDARKGWRPAAWQFL
jgi:hypothetical protein